MQSDSSRNVPGFSQPFVVNAKKRKKHGWTSGGIAVYCKSNIRNNTYKVKNSISSLWLKLDKFRCGLKSTIYVFVSVILNHIRINRYL